MKRLVWLVVLVLLFNCALAGVQAESANPLAGFMSGFADAPADAAAAEDPNVSFAEDTPSAPGLTLIRTFDRTFGITGSNRLASLANGAQALMDYDGNLLTDYIYNSFHGYGDWIVADPINVDDFNREGLLDAQGNEVIPFKYGMIEIVGGNYALCSIMEQTSDTENYDLHDYAADAYYNTVSADIYSLSTGAMITLSADAFNWGFYENGCLCIADNNYNYTYYDRNLNCLGSSSSDAELGIEVYYESTGCGLKDANGNVLTQPIYDFFYSPRGNCIQVEKDGKCGALALDGTVLLEPLYDDIIMNFYHDGNPDSSDLNADGYFCVELDGKIAYATAVGLTCDFVFSTEALLDNYGASAIVYDESGNECILAADGVVTVLDNYEYVEPEYSSQGFYYSTMDEDYYAGLIDWHGNELLPCEYTKIDLSADGNYVIALSSDYNTCEFYALNKAVPAAGSAAVEAPAVDAAPVIAETPVVVETPVVAEEVFVAAEETPAVSTSSGVIGASKGVGKPGIPGAEEAPVEEAPVEAAPAKAPAAVDNSAAVALLDSARLLISTNPAVNAASASVLLDNAAAMLTGNSAAITMIDSVKALLTADAASNASAILLLLDNTIAML